jgi:hypothetical protein
VWVPRTQTLIKARDVVFDELRHVKRTTIHTTDDDDTPSLWVIDGKVPTFAADPLDDENIIPPLIPSETFEAEIDYTPIQTAKDDESMETEGGHGKDDGEDQNNETVSQDTDEGETNAPKDFSKGPWMDPSNTEYGRGRRHAALFAEMAALACGRVELEQAERLSRY